MVDVFKALADPSRRHLLDRLNARNGQSLRDLTEGLDMARQSVSKHLAILEAANLVTTVRQGREKLHYLNPAPINEIAERWIHHYDRPRVEALSDLKRALEEMPMDKPQFVYTTYIKTTPERLWQALTEPGFTRRWWQTTFETDWAVGSQMTWDNNGVIIADPEQVVLESDPYRRLSYTWHTFTPELNERRELRGRGLRQAPERASLPGRVRPRAGRGVGEADRPARRLRAGQHGGDDGAQRLADAAVQPEDAARDRRPPPVHAGQPGGDVTPGRRAPRAGR